MELFIVIYMYTDALIFKGGGGTLKSLKYIMSVYLTSSYFRLKSDKRICTLIDKFNISIVFFIWYIAELHSFSREYL